MSEQKTPQQRLAGIVENLEEYLTHEGDEGIAELAINASVVSELGKAPAHTSVESKTQVPPTAHRPDSTLEEITQRIAVCTHCPLHETRTNTVPGQGHNRPEIAFVGEGPGADEDRQGIAFIGRAGKLLTKIIEAMGFTRDEVWIGNIVKCRPPGNRAPYPDEMEACLPYLKEQLAQLQPKVIVCLGATAVKGLLGVQTGITKLRGTWMSFEGIDVMPTFHPAYLLRNSAGKKPVWEDMKAVLERLGREPPPRKK